VCPKTFKFSIECKHYKSPPTFKAVVNQSVAQWDKWLQQAEQDAASSNRQMSLIVKYNNVDEIVFLSSPISGKHSIYLNYSIHLLSDWLALPDNYFFINDSP
jgi:hypothetical protein